MSRLRRPIALREKTPTWWVITRAGLVGILALSLGFFSVAVLVLATSR